MAAIPPKPPWIKDDPEAFNEDGTSAQGAEPGAVQRDANGHWLPGCPSPNPSGRARSNRQALIDGIEGVISVVKAAALAGDMTAAGLLLGRAIPTLRAEPGMVEFALDTSATPPEQRRQIREAVAQGRLTLDQAHQMTDLLDKHEAGDKWHPLIERFKKRFKSKLFEPPVGINPEIKLIDGKSTVIYPGGPNGKDSVN